MRKSAVLWRERHRDLKVQRGRLGMARTVWPMGNDLEVLIAHKLSVEFKRLGVLGVGTVGMQHGEELCEAHVDLV